MMSLINISVIVPVYNSASSIIRCLRSIEKQVYKANYQVIIINDGSDDNSKDIIIDYINHTEFCGFEFHTQKNKGVSSARNLGLRLAKGDYIALLDSDDEWLPDKIEKQMKVFIANPKIDFLGSNVTTAKMSFFCREITKLKKIKLWEQFIAWYPSTPTVIFKKDIVQDVGFYDESFTHGEDGQFLLRILMKKECWFIPDQLVEIGGGKPTFGHSGLSKDLLAMQKGQLRILKYAYDNSAINYMQFVFFSIYASIKHLRRILITKLR